MPDAPSPLNLERDARVRADLARHLKRSEPLRMAGNSLMALTVAAISRAAAPHAWIAAWLLAFLAHTAWCAWAAWRVWHRPTRLENAARRLRVVVRNEAINGVFWMLALLLLLPGSDPTHRALLMVLLSGMGSGMMVSLCAHPPALYAFFLPTLVGFMFAEPPQNRPYFAVALPLLLLWLLVNLNFARLMHRTLRNSLRNRHEADALAAELQVQNDRAVELGQTRSRFLAAASHDLRQPVHALSMFVGALGQQPPPEEAQRLLGHVRNTVDSLGEMFNALLDLSKLDAAMVRPVRVAVPLQPLLARVAADEGAVAQAKGLTLHWRINGPAGLLAHTDPMLLERILRNLLSNAVRYTRQGQVWLLADVRGPAVRLRVADTGVGIARAQRELVFQEFVQLHTQGHDREPGMGLGLAIVKRLTQLLGVRVLLRSRPGRGSVFSFELPLGRHSTPATGSAESAPAATAAHQLEAGDVVLVLDDAPDIRLAMTALLTGWGCQVLAAAHVDALQPQLMTLQRQPRLIICDGQLSGGASGAAAIEELRQGFNDEVPAIVITGDTAPERLREAAANGLSLLHKPVAELALRHAIAAALAGRPAGAVAG
jgi:signal transduction histidine kinase